MNEEETRQERREKKLKNSIGEIKRMILVVTTGHGAMSFYSQKLSENISAPVIQLDILQKLAKYPDIFQLPLRAIMLIRHDWQFIRRLNRLGDVVHLPSNSLGHYGNFLNVPFIITVHDLIRYFDLKENRALINRPSFRDRLRLNMDYKGIKKATRIIAVSQATKNDLIHYLDIPEEQISVVPLGVDHNVFHPVSHRASNRPYVLFVGSEHPRKNLAQLLKAFSQLKSEPEFKDLKLVKVGKAGSRQLGNFRKQTTEVINSLGLTEEVIFTDFVSERELPAYYSGATVFVFPSLYEGFGLPPLEAMACGCPVITSNTSSLPEVVGEAGIMVDPYDTDGLVKAMRQVLTNNELRNDMIRKGLEQAKRFSWGKTAEMTQEVYDK